MLQLVSHHVEMQNLKVNTCIYHTDTTVAVEKRAKRDCTAPSITRHTHANMFGLSGFTVIVCAKF